MLMAYDLLQLKFLRFTFLHNKSFSYRHSYDR